jgi:putative sterol carrier protein
MGRMRFLSPEWLDHLASRMASAGASGHRVSVHQRVTGGPEGDVEYTVRLEGDTVTVEPGPGPADVQLVQDYATAAAISEGRLSPAAAFAAGRLKLGGRVGLLVEHQVAFAALAAAAPADTVTY